MGLEWHNRRRNPNGTFKKESEIYTPIMQMHVRMPKDTYKDIRRYAIEAEQEMTAYVLQAVQERIERDRRARWS